MPVLTPELAAEYGRRSGASRRLHPVRQTVPRVNGAVNGTDTDKAVQTSIERQLRLVLEQIARTRAVLNNDRWDWCEHCKRGGVGPHHRAQLLRSLDTLLDRERVLRGIPTPGQLRPTAQRSAPRPVGGLAPRAAEPPTESQNGPQTGPAT